MKPQLNQLTFIIVFICNTLFSQTNPFQDTFESYDVDQDISNEGYTILQSNSYEGNVTSLVKSETDNQYLELFANPNGQAIMRLRKTVTVAPETDYSFLLQTRGLYKRRFEILDNSNNVLFKSNDFTPTEAQKTEWVTHQLNFTTDASTSTIKIQVFHNWSGRLAIDNLEVINNSPTPLNYYISANGDDTNSGSIGAPWKTLEKVSNSSFNPGDKILFRKGDRFDGHLVLNSSGKTDSPITISSYGTGNQPIITGEVGEANGGDYQEAIYIENQDNIIFEDIEVNNERLSNRTGVDEEDAYGIYILNASDEIKYNYTFRNVTFKNVYAPKPVLDADSFNGLEVAAVRIETSRNTELGKEKNIENILMEECYFSDLQRLGVHIKHLGGNTGIGNDEINCTKNLIFRNNEFHNLGGTCILPIRTYNCLIEHNIFDRPGDDSDPRMPNRGSSVWNWHCHNTVIQYNQCLHIRGYLDSHGIHVDHENVDTFIQYNYMEDCEGGFVEILGGNTNAVYRFNISVNDGWRENPNWVNSNHTIWINEVVPNGEHYSDQNYIYNNTIYIDQGYETAIDVDGTNHYIYNNIFTAINGSGIGTKRMAFSHNNTSLTMTNNLYEGNIAQSFINLDSNPITGNSNFIGANDVNFNAFSFQLNSNSDAINNGIAIQGPPIPGAGTGIFENIPQYPTTDYFGNPLDLSSGTPNIGACNAKNGENLSDSLEITSEKASIYPNPATDYLQLKNIPYHTEVLIYNQLGQLKIQTNNTGFIDIKNLVKGIYILRVNNMSLKFVKD